MKKNMVKILSMFLVAVMILSVSNAVFAAGAAIEGVGQQTSESLITGIGGATGGTTVQKVKNVGNIVIGVIQTIGVVAAIIMLVFLGIKYVSAAPSEKADIKKSASIYVVGAVMLLGASVILGWISGFVSDLNV